MTVGLAPEQIESEVDKRLRDFSRSARLPGFRPGKVPVKILRQRYGEKVQREVFGELVQSTFTEALTQENLNPAGMPKIEQDIDPSAKRYAYTAVFEVLPTFEIASLEGKVLKRPRAEVAEEDIDALVERMRAQRKTWGEVERPARDGDKLTISYVGTIDGEAFDGGSAQDIELELGSGRMIPGFESGLLGAAAGEERTLDIQFPDDYPADHLKGKPVAFVVSVKRVSESSLPEADADFVKAFGVEDGDLDRFRQDVRGNMERELKQRVDAKIKGQVMELLLETNQIDLPRVLVTQEIRTLKEQTKKTGGGSPIELPDALFLESARRRVALGLIIAEVVRSNNIQVDEVRVHEAVADMASTYERPQDVVDYYYSKKENLAPVETLALEGQVVDWVSEQVTVEDEPASFRELTEPGASA